MMFGIENNEERCTRKQLLLDLIEIEKRAKKKGYIFTHEDTFALGYMLGKYQGITKIIDNDDTIHWACEEYDKTDDLELLDTISETLIDLGVIAKRG